MVERYEQLAGLEQVLKKIAQNQEYKKINIAISGPATIIRYADFPKMKEEDFKRSLKFEAQKHIPFTLSEVNIDGAILKEELPDNKMLVLLAAVKKDAISPRLKMCEDLGLKVNIISMDSVALMNAFNYNYSFDPGLKNKTVALINIGGSFTNLNILEDGLPRLSRDIHIAGNNLTQRIADVLGVDYKAAENIKIGPDKQAQDKINLAVEPVFTNLAKEIRISFDFYESQSASSVEKIFVSGGGVLFLGADGILKNILGVDVEFWNPLKHIDISPSLDSQLVSSLSGQLAVAVGLALQKSSVQ